MPSIMIDAGHGGANPGAVYNGRQEKDDNLRLALAVGEILQNSGIEVLYTRTTDINVPLLERANMANQSGVDYFVSIHRNSYPVDNEVNGILSLVYQFAGVPVVMAENINAELENVGFVNLGIDERPNLVVLRRTAMPSVLVEVGFINSDIDNQLFDNNFNAIAQGIANGILSTISGAGTAPATTYSVQVGLFRNPEYATRLLTELTAQGFPAYIDDYSEFIRVKVGEFRTSDEAAAMERRLNQAGYQTLVVSHTA